MKKITVFIIMLCSMIYINCFSVFALDHGIYIVPTVTSYKNPETGVIDDAGSDAALGEAMCRSAVGTNALVEIDSNGKIYVTLRILLKSNISNVKFYTQGSKGGSYSETKATVMVEDTGADYADYRFEVKDTSFYISPEFYVIPMGRNVKFYVSLNTASAKSGSGDFVTSIKVNQTTTEATTEVTTKTTVKETTTEATTNTATTNTTTKETTTEATTNSVTKEDETKENSSETEVDDIKQTLSETEESTDKANETLEISNDDEINELEMEDELSDEEINNLNEEEIEDEEDVVEVFNESENVKGGSSKWVILGVIVIIVIAGGIFIIKKKKA